jgi:precorrin-6B methylase 1
MEVYALEELTLPTERITHFEPSSLASSSIEFSDLTVLVFPVPPAGRPS